MPSIQHPDHPMLRLLQQLFGFLATCALQQRCTGFLVVEMSQFPGHLAGSGRKRRPSPAEGCGSWDATHKTGRNERKVQQLQYINSCLVSLLYLYTTVLQTSTDYGTVFCGLQAIVGVSSRLLLPATGLSATRDGFSELNIPHWEFHLQQILPSDLQNLLNRTCMSLYVLYQALYNLYQFQTSPSHAIACHRLESCWIFAVPT